MQWLLAATSHAWAVPAVCLAADVCCCAGNKAGPEGIKAIGAALEAGHCPALQHLDIRSAWALGCWWLVLHRYTAMDQADSRVLVVLRRECVRAVVNQQLVNQQ